MRAVNGHPWHGPALQKLLDGLMPAHAAAHPIPGGHSIWELVLHLTSWARECARRLRDGVARDPEMGDWPKVSGRGAAAWTAARDALFAAHEEVLAALGGLDENRLDQIVRDVRSRPEAGVSYHVLLHGLAQHYAYHGGQIALLSRALANMPGTIR